MSSAHASLFMGGIHPLHPAGIFKQETMMSAWIGIEGLSGDAQADRRVHGGPDQALHRPTKRK
jgi:MOSC domain-containing protein YiiM